MKLFSAIAALTAVVISHLPAGEFGTGFVISPKGYIVTCHHVVNSAERIVVHSKGGAVTAHVVALDARNDLVILKIPKWEGTFLGLTSATEISHASPVTVVGFPDPGVLGINPKVSLGNVNSLSGVRDDPRYLQISAPAQPGNSGGPVVSASGEVVGVLAAGLNSVDRMKQSGYIPQSVNFAIKADLVYPLLKTAGVKPPTFGTKNSRHAKQVERALNAIVLIESFAPGQTQPIIQRTPRTSHPRAIPPQTAQQSTHLAPWLFPNSHTRVLNAREVKSLTPAGLWRARNEIYLRRGFHFTSPEGVDFARRFGPLYRPRTKSVEAVQRELTEVEIANLKLISSYEAAHRR